MKTDLYNSKTIKKKYEGIKLTKTQKQIAKEWIQKLKSKELEKEKENYFTFRDYILRDLLGYPEKKILYEKKFVEFSIEDNHGDTGVCFEAKGTETKDLHAYQGRGEDQATPVIQTRTNMERFPSSFGVCTNYRNFILLDINKKSKYYEFDFLDIENDENKLKEFINMFSYENLVVDKSLDQLYDDSVSEERDFTKEFYKLYHETRLMLIKVFQEKENVSMDDAIHFSQLFLNRLIFTFFAEDKEDLPDRLFSIKVLKILEKGDCTKKTQLISNYMKKLFKYLDVGNVHEGIFGFNGDLFKEKIPTTVYFYDLKNPDFFKDVKQHSKLSKNIELDELSSKIIKKYEGQINPIISNLLIMDSFDFTSDVNVNILGHIFEQSISDLEELKQEGVSKRKKDGVYYTPEYITEYICSNTIIPYLSKTNVSTIEELIFEYIDDIDELEKRIKNVKILDPACGSGAFLVKSVEILLGIDKMIADLKHPLHDSTLDDWRYEKEITKIIEKNIFGVDINEESVEITKLSLFLQMAAPNKKLSSLSKNIKVGNSLIDDKNIDEKAFSWEKEFHEVMDSGKFDIIIGNPPYLRIQGLHESHEHITNFIEKNYESATGRYDFYVLFIEKCKNLLKKEGYLGFITPHKFTNAIFGKGIRKILSGNKLIHKFLSFGHNFVFENVTTYTGILVLKNQVNKKFLFHEVANVESGNLESKIGFLKSKDFVKIDQEKLNEKPWALHSGISANILKKIKNSGPNVLELFDKVLQGIVSGDDDLYFLKLIKDKGTTMILFSTKTKSEVEIEKELLKPILFGKDVKRNGSNDDVEYFLLHPYIVENGTQRTLEETELKSNYPLAYRYLSQFKSHLTKLKIKFKTNSKYWYALHRARRQEWFEQERIITPEISLGCNMTYDKNKNYHNSKIYSFLKKQDNKVDTKYFLGIFNSKVMWFFLKSTGDVLRGGYFTFKTQYLSPFHVPLPSNETLEKEISSKVNSELELNQQLNETYHEFLNRMKNSFSLETISKKLKEFYFLNWNELINEISELKKLEPTKQDHWQKYFEDHKEKILNLKISISEIDDQINRLVYTLYNFTPDEISVIENNYPLK
jgi:hypothetical protein